MTAARYWQTRETGCREGHPTERVCLPTSASLSPKRKLQKFARLSDSPRRTGTWLENAHNFAEALRVPELDISSEVRNETNLTVVSPIPLPQNRNAQPVTNANH
jgi:hypothetical protein